MKQAVTRLRSAARAGKGLYEFTARGGALGARRSGHGTGLLTLFCQHTSASLVIQENADPDVQTDLRGFFDRLVPEDDRDCTGTRCEGPDDMPAHIRSRR